MSRSLTIASFLVAALVGCGDAKKSPPQSGAPAAGSTASYPIKEPVAEEPTADAGAADTEKKPAAASGQVTAEIKDFDGIQSLIASKRGKVVVMDCWSTWCDPCVKEFPGLVALHKKYGTEDLACISLSFNYDGGKNEKPEDHTEQVLEFLRTQDAAFDNVIASVPTDELYELLGFKTASVPAIFVYDRQGNLARQFGGEEAKYAEVGKLVAELIEQPSETSDRRAEE
ncbi:MAG TPA: TlpA disulfide reductase family protein [Pirellulales bacterium]|jgi:thiol-disulfide isomerase/thioredoxin|nr:TlpA disulfide reductase family protein [Pirellulales bacterium]